MTWGFGTWDADGVDNNTGLVRVNALATLLIDATSNYTQAYSVPSGYTLDFLFQPNGEVSGTGRKSISVNGNTITVSQVDSGNYSNNTFPNVPGALLLFVR